ncbi:MAG TPA: HdeD family acid-resistance protein [Bryobacteraceae bacterium]
MAVSSANSRLFTRRWWTVLLRGVIAVIFGIAAFAWPHLTIATLILLFGWWALIHGIFAIAGAIAYRPEAGNRWLLALEGVVGIWAGIVTLHSPSTTAVVLIFFVWVWAIATGILRIVEAIRLRKQITGEVWLALSGLVTVVFGVMLMLRPVASLVALAWVIAAYALLLGLFEIMLGLELRTLGRARIGTT